MKQLRLCRFSESDRSGGLASARRAASYGVKVAVAEKAQLGGTCVVCQVHGYFMVLSLTARIC